MVKINVRNNPPATHDLLKAMLACAVACHCDAKLVHPNPHRFLPITNVQPYILSGTVVRQHLKKYSEVAPQLALECLQLPETVSFHLMKARKQPEPAEVLCQDDPIAFGSHQFAHHVSNNIAVQNTYIDLNKANTVSEQSAEASQCTG